jgi:hypothetical protein
MADTTVFYLFFEFGYSSRKRFYILIGLAKQMQYQAQRRFASNAWQRSHLLHSIT